jgi:multisubunit Na+/H+ antiporter MnhC subunit
VADSEDSTRESERGRRLRLAIAVVLALAIGLAVPLLWVWIGSKLQGGGTDTVNSSTAAIIFAGIVLTYLGLLFFAGWIIARGEVKEAERRPPTRYPWNRSMRDEAYRPGERRLSPIESAFVFTTVVVTAAFMVWFFVFAGSPLPNQ